MEILKMSLSAAVLIPVIVIIRMLALHKLPRKTFSALWGVALLRLLLPFSIPSHFGIYSFTDGIKMKFPAAAVFSGAGVTPDTVAATGIANAMFAGGAAGIALPLVLVWLAGLLACSVFFAATHLRCRREYKTALPVDNGFVEGWRRKHSIRRRLEIRQSDKIAAPLTYGIIRPVILLPRKTDWEEEARLEYILAHEFTHVRRFDTLAKCLLAAALCIHWFNPLVWVMYMLAGRDIELSCDETVVRTFGENARSAYAMTLIGLEEKKGSMAPLCNNFSKNAIEERVVSVMKIKKATVLSIILAVTLIVGAMTVFAVKVHDPADLESQGETGESSSTSISYEDVANYMEYDKQNGIYRFDGKWVRLIFDAAPDGNTSSYGMEPGPYDNWGNSSVCLKTVRNGKTHEIEGLTEMTGQEAEEFLQKYR